VPTWVNTLQRRNYTVHRTPEGRLLHIQYVDFANECLGNALTLNLRSTRGGGYTGELWWRKVD
jgi:hypothetical protein